MKVSEIYNYANSQFSKLKEPMRKIMTAYQNGARWFDSIQEELMMERGLRQIPLIIHQMAHSFPQEFDKFSEILHTKNLKVEYPSTDELIVSPEDLLLGNVFKFAIDVINSIDLELSNIISICDNDNELKSLVDSLSQLQTNNVKKAETIFSMWRMFDILKGEEDKEEKIYVSFENWIEEHIKAV